MKKNGIIIACIIFLMAPCAFAIQLGDNITVYDGMKNDNSGTWYKAQEDNEVEPWNIAKQGWDLEGFFLDGDILTMVGGFDFENGYGDKESGDIFIDVDGDSIFGPANDDSGFQTTVQNTFGYDYVIDLDFTIADAPSYSVYQLTENTTTILVDNKQSFNQASNPWRYNDGGVLLAENLVMGYDKNLTSNQVGGLLGDTHYALSVDISFLQNMDFTAHFTMECGNDNLRGGTSTVPEPSSMILLGMGMIGMTFWMRRKKS